MVVDDEAAIRDLLVALLEDEGYAVVTAEDGHQALDLLRTERPDLVLLDIMMPGMDGREVCRRMRDMPNGRDLPIVLMSAAMQPEVGGCPVSAFLPKPFDIEQLLHTIQQAIGSGLSPGGGALPYRHYR